MLEYALLDQDNTYGIQRIGYNHARTGLYKSWDADVVLQQFSGISDTTLQEERKAFFNDVEPYLQQENTKVLLHAIQQIRENKPQ